LEIVLLTALLTFQDANEAHHSPEAGSSSTNPLGRASSAMLGSKSPSAETPPAPPPKPAPKTGIDRIAEMQAIKGEYNEIIVNAEGNIQEYAEYCNKLLQVRTAYFVSFLTLPKICRMMLCSSSLSSHRKLSRSLRFFKSSKKPNVSDIKQVRPAERFAKFLS